MSGWSGGSIGTVTVTNTGATRLTGWTVQLAMPSGPSVVSLWNGLNAGNTGTVNVKNAPHNGAINVGGTQVFGFVASGSGSGSQTVVGNTGNA